MRIDPPERPAAGGIPVRRPRQPRAPDRRRATPPASQQRLIAALAKPGRLAANPARVVETHISYVLLTGTHAYKIKKAIALPFLDFSTLDARRAFCDEELRLNARYAPGLYLDVVPITGTPAKPIVGGAGRVLEYAVRMREFPDDALLSRVLERDALAPALVDALAARVAHLHAGAPRAMAASGYGGPEAILAAALANFAATRERGDSTLLARLEQWMRHEYVRIGPALLRRRDAGAIRECHGDLHLGNVALLEGEPVPFDCIEFDPGLRFVDTMSEIAFMAMDLAHRGRPSLAHRFLSGYLEASGDYEGVPVLRFYLVYRAMVRAKVACLRAAQAATDADRIAGQRELDAYVGLASTYAHGAAPTVVVMHGPSGCGKTTLSQPLLERSGALRVRTDVERKRQAGLAASARSGSAVDAGLYGHDVTERTYERVEACARAIVDGGFAVIADGAFLRRWQRDRLRELAAHTRVPFVIVDCVASRATLEARVEARAAAGSDASEANLAVLAHQRATAEPLGLDELPYTIACNTEVAAAHGARNTDWRVVVERIGARTRPPGHPHPAPDADGALAGKVRFLACPASYPRDVMSVEPVETHLSWVFLTGRHAYKLKKPVRTAFVDFCSVEARRRNGIEELRANRRFGSDVYLGMVALARTVAGQFRLGDGNEVVDWLVQMRRLPADRMLDRLIIAGRFKVARLRPVVDLLCRVYGEAARTSRTGEEYREHLIAEVEVNHREIVRPEFGLPVDVLSRIHAGQARFLEENARDFHERVRAGRVAEGHGDLRPEHVCLERVPQIIDSLEFSRELRTLDSADELGFLALECERLGAPQARRAIFDAYARACGDAPPDALVHFYQSHRACVRARLAIAHVLDPVPRDPERWPMLARHYVELALDHIERCR